MRILVVDDEVSLCCATAEFLREEGFDVIEVFEPSNAVVIANEEGANIAAVVTDVDMPGMNGLEMWERIQRLSRLIARSYSCPALPADTYKMGGRFRGSYYKSRFHSPSFCGGFCISDESVLRPNSVGDGLPA